ncbi:GNAT family N-acetyltransferase [Geosporobacter ferrireducens]|uniref:GNAT family N-acetyltransferase n=1 Tax=Geosporobacter ferrireducens TaxID=1424294 RepID=UPI00139C4DD6|nr:GNAT family N-acetyltransferase [Geosporobacter ferrireducens]MTI57869.1 GNAT family N-acetyltransferase [Geosporobacter ferrireducens]
MITYKQCTEVHIDAIYEAFQQGFSDYIIDIAMPKEAFVKRFFGPEGNHLKYSYIALDGQQPIGLILGGIKEYEGVKTLRCGTLCIHPGYRGQGVSQNLFERHKKTGIANRCKQLFLEVIIGNDRAIGFYKGLGYDKIYELSYYYHEAPLAIDKKGQLGYEIELIRMDEVKALQNRLQDIHINWQNDFDYIEKLENKVNYGIFKESVLIGAISMLPSGKIHFIWVDPRFRHQGIGRNLIGYGVKELKPEKLHISFPNNSNLQGFVKRTGFIKDSISQQEMYLVL